MVSRFPVSVISNHVSAKMYVYKRIWNTETQRFGAGCAYEESCHVMCQRSSTAQPAPKHFLS